MTNLPNISEDSDYARESSKLQRYARELGAARARLDAVHAAIAAHRAGSPSESPDATTRADALLDGVALTVDTTPLHAEVAQLHQTIQVLQAGLAAQGEITRRAVLNASVAAVPAIRGEHQKIARGMLSALREMDALARAEDTLRDSFEAAGFDASALAPHLSWNLLGRIDDSSGSLAFYRDRELAAYVGPDSNRVSGGAS